MKKRQHSEAAVVDVHLRGVETPVAGDDIVQRVAIAAHQALERKAYALLGEAPHREDPFVQFS
jgi:transposase